MYHRNHLVEQADPDLWAANQAVFLAFLQPGKTIMEMSLAEGGHLAHGMPLNLSGKWFKVESYALTAKEEIHCDAMEAKARATAHLIADVLDNPSDETHITAVRNKVHALTSPFPVYG